ncbi:MAG: hypothetical protein ACOWW1_07385 [archaeon]
MRSYIFTPKERRAIQMFLDGELPASEHLLSQVRTRMKQFKTLADDVHLYALFREAITTSST